MDDESEADLYGDLLPFDRRNDEDFKKMEEANAKLKHENDQLKQRIERLLLENRSLAQDKKKLETNFSSLIKTAQTEMKRKDQTIAELRREKDSVVFRRGRNTRYDGRPQERIQPDSYEIHRPEPVEQSWAPPCAPKPSNQPLVTAPIVEEVKSVVIPANRAEEVAAVVTEVVPNVPTIVPTSNECPKTVFSKRHSSGVNKPEATLPTVPVVEIKPVKEKPPLVTVPIPTVSTPETQPESKKKKRITPVLISEPTPRAVDKNKNKVLPPVVGLDKSCSKVATENCTPITVASELSTPKAASSHMNHVTPITEPIVIPKSKIITHVKATYDTSNAKTTNFKRRVSAQGKDVKPKPASSPKSPLRRISSFASENSSDSLRRPSNYDLMKRNVKVKYHALDSPKKSERSRRSRSRSVWPREKRDRSKQSRRVRSDGRSEPRRKDDDRKLRSPSRRTSKVSTDVSFKRDSTPPRRRESPGKRRVPTFNELKNFSPVQSSTAKKESERKSSRDRSMTDVQVPSTSKSKVRLHDVLEKSAGKRLSADQLDRSQIESTIAVPKIKVPEPLTDLPTAKPTESAKQVPSSKSTEPKNPVNVLSPSKSSEAKRKSIEAVADSLTIKLTSIQTTETTSKTVEALTVAHVPKATTSAEGSEPKTQLTTVTSTTKTQTTDVLSVLTQSVMPIPPRDFLSARILADYKTPTASAENSREVSQPKTMSPPDVPRPKPGPISFSGIKLGDPKAFSYPFTPLKMDITKDCISFPSLITPLKATPVKVDCVEEDSLDVMVKLHLSRNVDRLGVDAVATVTREPCPSELVLGTDKEEVASGGEKVDDVGGKAADKGVAVNDAGSAESRKEDDRRKESDVEDGEITDNESSKDTSMDTSRDTSKDISKDTSKDTSKDISKDISIGSSKDTLKYTSKVKSKNSSKELAKPMVTFFKRSRAEPKGKRTRTVAAETVVGADQMSDLRRKLLARNECVAPARKDMRDYEIRLKSPFKTSPRVSSAKRAPRASAVVERLTYEIPDSARRSRSPSAMFLAKSPERIVQPSPRNDRGQSRSESPNGRRVNVAKGNVPRKEAASSSRSRSPRDNGPTNSARERSHRETSDRHSTSSRSRSPQPPPLKRPARPRPISQSRSRSPKPAKRSQRPLVSESRSKSPTRLDERSHRSRCSPTRRSRSRSVTPPKIRDRLLRLANCNGGGEFRRRTSRYVDDSTGDRTQRKSRSRSASPSRHQQRNSRSQESRESRAESEKTDRSGSSEGVNARDKRVGNVPESSGGPFRRRRAVFRDPTISERNKELIERILDSGSGISEKNVSPVKLQRSVVTSPPDVPNLPDILATLDNSRSPMKQRTVEPKSVESKPVESKPVESRPVEPRPVESRLVESKPVESKPVESKPVESKPVESKQVESRPVESRPVESEPAESRLVESEQVSSQPVGSGLDDIVSRLVRSGNPDVQKCLDSLHTNFAPPKSNQAATEQGDKANKQQSDVGQKPSAAPLTNGFARKRRSVRMLPPTIAMPSPKAVESIVEVPKAVEVPKPVKVTPPKLDQTTDAVRTPNEVGQAGSASKAVNGQVSANTNGFPFARRRRPIRMLPPSNSTTPNPTPNPTPTKESETRVSASPLSDAVPRVGSSMSPKPTDAAKSKAGFPILERALVRLNDSSADRSSDSLFGTQASWPGNRIPDAEDRRDKRKRDSNGSSDGNPWTGRKRRVVMKEAKASEEMARKAKSLFGSDTEEDADYSVRDSEYAKLASESEEDSFVSDAAESDDSQEHWRPPRKHSRKKPASQSDDSGKKRRVSKQRTPEPTTSIWPARPEEPKRRTTVFLEDLPKSSEKLIEELMNRANKTMSAKKKKRHSVRAKTVRASAKAPKSAELVPTDSDSD